MAAFRILRRMLLPATGLTGTSVSLAWSASVYAKEKFEKVQQQNSSRNETVQNQNDFELHEVRDDRTSPKRPSDLSLYDEKAKCDYYGKAPTNDDSVSDIHKKSANRSATESKCKTCSADKPKEGKSCEGDPENKAAKIGAGGLVGALLGWKGGIMRKIVFATLGAGGVAIALYPEDTVEFGNSTFCFIKENGEAASTAIKKFGTTTYHFLLGPKHNPRCPDNKGPTAETECGGPLDCCPALGPPEKKPEDSCPPKPCD